jgi:hypothetical protein
MGQIIDILQIRYEEMQISWACSAQNPDLLPDSIKKAKKGNGRERLKERAEREFKHGK